VNILRCHLRAFGKFCDLKLTFGEGLNLIFAANEGGKSTLQRFLIGLLYGQLRADLHTQKRLDAWADQYKPWHGSDYGGTVWCSLAGREIEVRRTFGKEEDRVEIRTGAGEDITSQYQRLRNGDLLFAQHHLKLPKELFESVAVVRENRAGELEGRETLRDRIANLAQSGDERLSVRRCLSRLEEALESIGSERAPTRPLKQTLEQLRTLQAEKEALLSRRAEFQKWILERSRLADELKCREQDLRRAGWVVRAARFKEAQLKMRTLEEIDAEIRTLREEMVAVGGDPGFPVSYLDELNQLEWAQQELQKRSTEITPGKQRALVHLQALAAERQKLEPYAGLVATAEADKVTEWFVRYLSLSRQRDDAQQASDALRQETESLAEALSGCGPLVVSSEVDWQQVSLEASERERIASQQVLALGDKISAQKTALSAEKGRRVRWMVLGSAAAAIALAFGLWIGGLLGPARPQAGRAHLASMAFSVGAAVLLFGAGWLAHRRVRQGNGVLRSLEAEQAQLRGTPNEPYNRLSQAAAESGFAAVEEFLAATMQASQVRQRMDDLASRLQRSEQERQKIHAEADQVYLMLKETLGKVGLGCAPANLTEQIDVLRANLRRYRELDAGYREGERRVESLQKEDAQLSGEIEAKHGRMRAILAETGLSSIGQFREECRKCKRLLELRDKESSRTREFLRLSGDLTLEQWRQSLKDLEEKVGDGFRASDASIAPLVSDGHRAVLPYLPNLSDAEQEEKRIGDSVASLREEHARVCERVSQAFRGCRTLAEVEEDLRLTERAAQGLARNRKALSIALSAIRELSRRQQEVSAPRLNRAVESRFQRICQGRYKEVKIDPDFQVWLREAATDELRNAESLSRGTQDQLYFALRFGILEMLTGGEEPCPCFLDEPFAAYDHARIAEAFQILEEEGGRRQILLFSCREDIRDLARGHDAHVVEIGI
jgi:uncharacterized protein YhaN